MTETDPYITAQASNTYPGCACDVPSLMYSWSFAPNPEWTSAFAPATEIFAYQQRVVNEQGLRAYIRFEHDVTGALWSENTQRWQIETSAGDYTAEVLISAVGALHAPSVPELPGIESFAGRAFHSAQWEHEPGLAGRRVAVIGTGASAIQIVPEIAPEVEHLTLFQRTPPWVLPRWNPPIPGSLRRLFRLVPATQKAARAAIYTALEALGLAFRHPILMRLAERRLREHIAREVSDPELLAKLTPDYRIGCKRLLGSNTYYPALCAANVDVVSSGIREVRPEGIVDRDGVLHELDTIIYGTGFRVADMPVGELVRGCDGRTLAEHWNGSPKAYFGTAVAGFPNFYMLLGPGTGLGHNSIIYMLESQARYISRALRFMREAGVTRIEPRAEAQAAWVDYVDSRMRKTVWMRGGCNSWYIDDTGRNSTLWPQSTFAFRRRLARFAVAEHHIGRARAAELEALPR